MEVWDFCKGFLSLYFPLKIQPIIVYSTVWECEANKNIAHIVRLSKYLTERQVPVDPTPYHSSNEQLSTSLLVCPHGCQVPISQTPSGSLKELPSPTLLVC